MHGICAERGRLIKVHIGDHEDGQRMLQETIGQPAQAVPEVVQAMFLGHNQERDIGVLVVQCPQDTRNDHSIPQATVKNAERRRLDRQICHGLETPVCNHPFFVAGIGQQVMFQTLIMVFVGVVRPFGCFTFANFRQRLNTGDGLFAPGPALYHFPAGIYLLHEQVNPVDCTSAYTRPVTCALDKFPIIDGESAQG